MLIKIILFIVILFTGFVCGGAMATKMYAERVAVMQKYTDKTTNITLKISDDLLACRATLEMGRGL